MLIHHMVASSKVKSYIEEFDTNVLWNPPEIGFLVNSTESRALTVIG